MAKKDKEIRVVVSVDQKEAEGALEQMFARVAASAADAMASAMRGLERQAIESARNIKAQGGSHAPRMNAEPGSAPAKPLSTPPALKRPTLGGDAKINFEDKRYEDSKKIAMRVIEAYRMGNIELEQGLEIISARNRELRESLDVEKATLTEHRERDLLVRAYRKLQAEGGKITREQIHFEREIGDQMKMRSEAIRAEILDRERALSLMREEKQALATKVGAGGASDQAVKNLALVTSQIEKLEGEQIREAVKAEQDLVKEAKSYADYLRAGLGTAEETDEAIASVVSRLSEARTLTDSLSLETPEEAGTRRRIQDTALERASGNAVKEAISDERKLVLEAKRYVDMHRAGKVEIEEAADGIRVALDLLEESRQASLSLGTADGREDAERIEQQHNEVLKSRSALMDEAVSKEEALVKEARAYVEAQKMGIITGEEARDVIQSLTEDLRAARAATAAVGEDDPGRSARATSQDFRMDRLQQQSAGVSMNERVRAAKLIRAEAEAGLRSYSDAERAAQQLIDAERQIVSQKEASLEEVQNILKIERELIAITRRKHAEEKAASDTKTKSARDSFLTEVKRYKMVADKETVLHEQVMRNIAAQAEGKVSMDALLQQQSDLMDEANALHDQGDKGGFKRKLDQSKAIGNVAFAMEEMGEKEIDRTELLLRYQGQMVAGEKGHIEAIKSLQEERLKIVRSYDPQIASLEQIAEVSARLKAIDSEQSATAREMDSQLVNMLRHQYALLSAADQKKVDEGKVVEQYERAKKLLSEQVRLAEDLGVNLRKASSLTGDNNKSVSGKEKGGFYRNWSQRSLNQGVLRDVSRMTNDAMMFGMSDDFATNLRVGLMSISNNLDMLFEGFAEATKKAGGFTNALKGIGGAAIGIAGIPLAINAVTTGFQFAAKAVERLKQKTKTLNDVLEETRELRIAESIGAEAAGSVSESDVDKLEKINERIEILKARADELGPLLKSRSKSVRDALNEMEEAFAQMRSQQAQESGGANSFFYDAGVEAMAKIAGEDFLLSQADAYREVADAQEEVGGESGVLVRRFLEAASAFRTHTEEADKLTEALAQVGQKQGEGGAEATGEISERVKQQQLLIKAIRGTAEQIGLLSDAERELRLEDIARDSALALAELEAELNPKVLEAQLEVVRARHRIAVEETSREDQAIRRRLAVDRAELARIPQRMADAESASQRASIQDQQRGIEQRIEEYLLGLARIAERSNRLDDLLAARLTAATQSFNKDTDNEFDTDDVRRELEQLAVQIEIDRNAIREEGYEQRVETARLEQKMEALTLRHALETFKGTASQKAEFAALNAQQVANSEEGLDATLERLHREELRRLTERTRAAEESHRALQDMQREMLLGLEKEDADLEEQMADRLRTLQEKVEDERAKEGTEEGVNQGVIDGLQAQIDLLPVLNEFLRERAELLRVRGNDDAVAQLEAELDAAERAGERLRMISSQRVAPSFWTDPLVADQYNSERTTQRFDEADMVSDETRQYASETLELERALVDKQITEEQYNQRIALAKEIHEANLTNIQRQGAMDRQAIDDAEKEEQYEKYRELARLGSEALSELSGYLTQSAQAGVDARTRQLVESGMAEAEARKKAEKEGKARFELSKKVAAAEAMVSAILSAQKAYESMSKYGPVAAAAAAAIALGAGLARVAAINSQQIGGSSSASSGSRGGSYGVQSTGATQTASASFGLSAAPQGVADASLIAAQPRFAGDRPATASEVAQLAERIAARPGVITLEQQGQVNRTGTKVIAKDTYG